MMQLNALLHVTQSKFNPCKREIVCRGIAIRQTAPLTSADVFLA